MDLNLTRPLLFFDIESTGLNIPADSIIELSFVKALPGKSEPEVKTWKIRPWDYENNCQRHISDEASKVNGVKDEDLKDCPLFINVASEIADWLSDSDLAGFNSARFDLPMLAEEFERVKQYCKNKIAALSTPEAKKAEARELLAKIEKVNLHEPLMVDVQNIYHAMEPRNLRAAYRFYCGGEDFENAHAAEADTLATFEVLKAQLDRYKEPDKNREQVLKNDVKSLSAFVGKKYVDFSGHLILGDDGEAYINFGKHKGRSARDVWKTDPSYFKWVQDGSFTLDTKAQFARLAESFRAERNAAAKRPATDEELQGLKDKFNGKLF
ncbi:MAG: 3'-5' exonuclease [Bacteroidales bacterium]|nr:3'-5' exonuclease [Bacteroidales bacterium]